MLRRQWLTSCCAANTVLKCFGLYVGSTGDLLARYHARGFGLGCGLRFVGQCSTDCWNEATLSVKLASAVAGLLHLPVPATGDVRRLDVVLEKEAHSSGRMHCLYAAA